MSVSTSLARILLLFPALALTLAHAGSAAAQPVPTGGPFDVVITNGRIVDGTGAAWFHGDLAIRGDRIARITPRGLLAERPHPGTHRRGAARSSRRGSSTSRATPGKTSWGRGTAGW
jgi:hypothetical protein